MAWAGEDRKGSGHCADAQATELDTGIHCAETQATELHAECRGPSRRHYPMSCERSQAQGRKQNLRK